MERTEVCIDVLTVLPQAILTLLFPVTIQSRETLIILTFHTISCWSTILIKCHDNYIW